MYTTAQMLSLCRSLLIITLLTHLDTCSLNYCPVAYPFSELLHARESAVIQEYVVSLTLYYLYRSLVKKGPWAVHITWASLNGGSWTHPLLLSQGRLLL